jgi:hypothetical protein
MPENKAPYTMSVSEFYTWRSEFERLARARFEERQNHGDYDTPYPQRVVEEMLMDVHLRLVEIEKLLDPTKAK